MTAMAQAVERQDWSLVALWLLLGVSHAASRLPPESLAALLDLLSLAEEERGPRRDG